MPKILIVDDDRTTTNLLRTLLEMDGFEVEISARGQMALEMAHEFKPDVFLVDYHLADMEGVDLVAQLRKDPMFANAPIVMASGLDVQEEAMRAGSDRFLIKPFEPGQLSDLFLDLLG